MLMKTVVKVGMEVWDKTISPKRGKVIEVFTDYKYDFPIKVEFENNVKVKYTTDGCFVKNKGTVPTLSTSDYSIETKGFEQKALVPTFEEAWKKTMRLYEPKSEYDKEEYKGYPSQELADASEALRRLLFLRDYYNEGWQPDWSNKNRIHFCIRVRNNKITIDNNSDINEFNTVLVFRDYTIRDKFLEEQRELLKIAKPLL